jgi:peptidoglycan glycosyltransferase
MRENIKKTAGVFLLLLAMLILYITYLQIFKGDELYESPYNKRTNSAAAAIKRGTIYDRSGEKLAYSEESGAGFRRVYPYGRAAAHVVGYTTQKFGSGGVEDFMQSYLSGSKNLAHGLGAIQSALQNKEGSSVRLTLDAKLQQAAYNALAGRKGSIVAINPKTGEILAMASLPSYNPEKVEENWETLQSDEDGILLNRAVQGLYPPGSVLKTLIADAALTEKVSSEIRTIECLGYLDVGEYRLPESHNAAHGTVDLKEAISVSCNTYFGTMALELGAEKMQDSFKRFGFAEKIDSAGFYETLSHIPNFGEMSGGDLAQSGIGQGSILVTPLRMAMLAATFANRGKLMRPYLVAEVRGEGGMVLKKYQPEKWLDITSAENADIIMRAMLNNVESGTGAAAAIDGVKVAGKTGTAENAKEEPHAWFIGVAPYESPSIAVAVILENAGGGGRYAAPAARQVIEEFLSEEGNR